MPDSATAVIRNGSSAAEANRRPRRLLRESAIVHTAARLHGCCWQVTNFIDGQLRHERDDAAESRFLNTERLSLYQHCGELEELTMSLP
jgi:hypothetical protein